VAALPDVITTATEIFKGYERAHSEEHRPHMGASLIGHECGRHIWLTWRWAETQKFEGRMLRLFQSGHLAEPRLVEDLRRIGVEVHDKNPDGSQWRVSAVGGHFGGSMDGCALGIPEAPKTWHVLEFKTSNQKSFDAMLKTGVQKAKPRHYAQMQVYMGLTGMERALYVMVNKNNDDIHSERVKFDRVEFARLMARAERLVKASEPPERISNDPSWWECKMCHFHAQCHGDQVPEVNCRTCAHSTPVLEGTDGTWTCAQADNQAIPLDAQRVGCEGHRYIPIFLAKTAQPVAYESGVVVYETPDKKVFGNGDGTQGTFSSHEIRKCGCKATLADMVPVKFAVATAKVVA